MIIEPIEWEAHRLNLEQTMQQFHAATGIPLTLYDGAQTVRHFHASAFEPDPALHIMRAALDAGHDVCYSATPDYVFCGAIRFRGTSQHLALGPCVALACSRKQAQNLLASLGQSASRTDELLRWLHLYPTFSLTRFVAALNFLAALTLALGANEAAVNVPYQSPAPPPPMLPIAVRHIDNRAEMEILSLVEHGRHHELESLLGDLLSLGASLPEYAPDAKRSMQVTFTVSTALTSRAALRGGLDYDTTMTLSEDYLRACEALDNYAAIELLLKRMMLDFAERTARVRAFRSASPLTTRICRHINAHLCEPISPKTIADELSMNRSHLCRQFKQDTGLTILHYIETRKIEEACRLLVATDMPLIQLSLHMGFSSQNYFHTVFKKQTGLTPTEYRSQA